MKNVYTNFSYASDHWAVIEPSLDQDFTIFIAEYTGMKDSLKTPITFYVCLNPGDKRGFRTLAILADMTDMRKTFNREYTVSERRGLSEVTIFTEEIYGFLGIPIVQVSKLGNNSQSSKIVMNERLERLERLVVFGNEKEPSILHNHLVGRGIPGTFIHGLDSIMLCPEVGELFPFGKGGGKKEPWKSGEMKKVSRKFREAIKGMNKFNEFPNLKIFF